MSGPAYVELQVTSRDVIRHALVGRIVDAYAKHEARVERGERPTIHKNREQRRR